MKKKKESKRNDIVRCLSYRREQNGTEQLVDMRCFYLYFPFDPSRCHGKVQAGIDKVNIIKKNPFSSFFLLLFTETDKIDKKKQKTQKILYCTVLRKALSALLNCADIKVSHILDCQFRVVQSARINKSTIFSHGVWKMENRNCGTVRCSALDQIGLTVIRCRSKVIIDTPNRMKSEHIQMILLSNPTFPFLILNSLYCDYILSISFVQPRQ